MTSIYDMVQNHFTHQEIHEISSKGISGAEILFILVERVLIGLTDHDSAIQCWFAILKKRVFSAIFILSCHVNDYSLYYASFFKILFIIIV